MQIEELFVKEKEKPKIEEIKQEEADPPFNIVFCQPIKAQMDKIDFCEPNIKIVFCIPIRNAKCLPDFYKALSKPTLKCIPGWVH